VLLYSCARVLYSGVVSVCPYSTDSPYSYWFPILSVYVTKIVARQTMLLEISFEDTLDGIGSLARGGHGTATTTGLALVIS
jgi:hypothetical protein